MATTIAVSRETKELLRKLGEKGESFDHLLQRLIKEVCWKKLDKRWNKILEEDDFLSMDEL